MSIFDLPSAAGHHLVLDGSMGTMLFERGLESGTAPELWNLEAPEEISALHMAYIEAGSDLILTNSFGGTSYRLALHGLDAQVIEISRLAAELARRAADSVERRVLVAGSMGPTGELLEPLGTMTADSCSRAFAEQATGLAAGGADLLWIETMSAIEEVEAAVAGARSVTELPLCATLSFDTAGRTMMGITASEAVDRLAPLGLAAIGANCGNNLADSEAALVEMLARDCELTVIAKCNAGIPQWRDGALQYDGGPDQMAAHAFRLQQAGVRLIGGCCGSRPEHIARIRGVLDGSEPPPEGEAAVVAKPKDPSSAPAAADRGRRSTSRRRSRSS